MTGRCRTIRKLRGFCGSIWRTFFYYFFSFRIVVENFQNLCMHIKKNLSQLAGLFISTWWNPGKIEVSKEKCGSEKNWSSIAPAPNPEKQVPRCLTIVQSAPFKFFKGLNKDICFWLFSHVYLCWKCFWHYIFVDRIR